MDDTLNIPNDYARRKENYQYFRTTCGLIGFIVFFLGAFFAFILAEETGQYENYTIILGIVMLGVTMVFFCCVLHQSRNLHSTSEFAPEQESLLQPQSGQELPHEQQQELKLSGKLKTEPHWPDKSRFDFAYIRNILGLSPRESDNTTSSGNDSDPDMMELRNMVKSELSTGIEEPVAGGSTELKDETKCEGATDIVLDSTKAEQLNDAGRFSQMDCPDIDKPMSNDFPLKDLSALPLSDSSNGNTDSKEEQSEVSDALSQFPFDPEKQASKIEIQVTSSTDSESKLDEQPSQRSVTSIKAEDGESSEVDSKIED